MAVAAFRQVLAHRPISNSMSSNTAGPPQGSTFTTIASSKIVKSGYPRITIYAEEGGNQLMIAAEMRCDWKDRWIVDCEYIPIIDYRND
jgi:hypothetical protein